VVKLPVKQVRVNTRDLKETTKSQLLSHKRCLRFQLYLCGLSEGVRRIEENGIVAGESFESDRDDCHDGSGFPGKCGSFPVFKSSSLF